MPRIEDHDLPHKAVYWPFSGADDYGNPSVGDPVEIDCRWVEKRGQTVDSKGNTVAFDASLALDRPVLIGSNLWRGELADFDDAEKDDLMQVNSTAETDDMKGRFTRYECTAKRFRDDLPTPDG
jgi:hypothetical protein